jgi:hypothetical protein
VKFSKIYLSGHGIFFFQFKENNLLMSDYKKYKGNADASLNKVIPEKYAQPILTAFSRYPELKHTHIHFKLTDKHPVPYGTTPTFGSLFKKASNRKYYITLLEEAEEPERSALFKNLPEEGQIAVIAHELVHVLQFNSCTVSQLLKLMLLYPFPPFKRKVERAADI